MFVCPEIDCGRKFTRHCNLQAHREKVHLNQDICEKCFLCGQIFNSCDDLQNHYRSYHKPSTKFVLKSSALRKNFDIHEFIFHDREINFTAAQESIKEELRKTITLEAAKKIICKVILNFMCLMSLTDHVGNTMEQITAIFRSHAFIANAAASRNIAKNIRRSFRYQANCLEEFIRCGSGWQFDRAIAFHAEIARIKPITAGRNSTKVNISNLQNSKFLYNPSNKNSKCFLYCIAHFLYGQTFDKKDKRSDEKKYRKYIKQFDTKKISFPISVEGIKKFLKKNKELDLKINILYRAGKSDGSHSIYPYEYGLGTGKKIVSLLMLQRNIDKIATNHFVLIADVNKYLRDVYRNENGSTSYQKAFFCLHCLNSFSSQRTLDDHLKICMINKPKIEIVPDETDNIIKFKNYERQHPLEYTGYLDFESVLPKKENFCDICTSLKCKCDASFTQIVSKQNPAGYSFGIVQTDEFKTDTLIHEYSYMGSNPGEHFIDHLLAEENRWIKRLLQTSKDMIYTNEDKILFDNATQCYICENNFEKLNLIKCRDHSHVNGKFLGAACNTCNLRRQKPNKLKIFIHNGSRYDFHFIISSFGSYGEQIEKINILPYNGENFRTISFNSFELIDSLAFLQAPLVKLCLDLKESGHDYKILKQTYLVKTNGEFDQSKYDMVLQKSFFPYEYCTSIKLMKSTKQLPKRKHFFSSLSEECISQKDYLFAKSVWKKFKCKNLLEYTKLYCKIDTMLLAEVFQKFRKDMHSFSQLDPAYYISLPAYAYDSMLKITKCEIGLPTEIDQVKISSIFKFLLINQ